MYDFLTEGRGTTIYHTDYSHWCYQGQESCESRVVMIRLSLKGKQTRSKGWVCNEVFTRDILEAVFGGNIGGSCLLFDGGAYQGKMPSRWF